jgi:uncharacterized membrane protein YhaH (DUF805 family)
MIRGWSDEMAEGNVASREITFSGAIASAFSRCFDYQGRSSRAEYWWFFLFSLAISFAVGFITKFASLAYEAGSGLGAALSILTTLIVMVPSFALNFRRMHDTNRSFWKFLLYSSLSSVPISIVAIIILQKYNQGSSFYTTTSFAVGYITAYIWSLVIYCLRGDVGENRFGPDPLVEAGPSSPLPVQGRTAVAPQTRTPRAGELQSDPYDVAGRELQSGAKHAGAWARAMVEADGDPARTEAAYVRLRVAALDAIAREDAARLIETERKAQEDAISRAADAVFNQARRQGVAISAEEAKLRISAKNAIEKRRASGAKLILISEVSALAKKMYTPYEDTIIMVERDVFRDGHGYRFDGRYYGSLSGVMAAAPKQARYEEKTVTGPAPSTGRISEGKEGPPEGSDDQPPFRWDDLR